MKAAMRKLGRDTIQRSVLSQFTKNRPNADQYINRLRFPVTPRIIYYSNIVGAQSYLQKIFPLFKLITPTTSGQTDEIISRSVAQQIFSIEDENSFGFLVKGFPFNVNQAFLLDKYLNGVNLVIHLSNQQNNDNSVDSLLHYYDQRGTLLRINYEDNPTADTLYYVKREVISNIKLSE